MVDVLSGLFEVIGTINRVANIVDTVTQDNKPAPVAPAPVEVVDRVITQRNDQPPVNINLTINVYKDSDSPMPLIASKDDNGNMVFTLK